MSDSSYGPMTLGSMLPCGRPLSEPSSRSGSIVADGVVSLSAGPGAESASTVRSGVVRVIRRPVCLARSATSEPAPAQLVWVAA
ncbi:hypothetical protein GCM10022379_39000 [Micromonospora maritima]